MRNIPGFLLLTCVSFFDFTSAIEFPEVSEEHITLEIGNGSFITGPLAIKKGIPVWLQPKNEYAKKFYVFILKKPGEGLSSTLKDWMPVLHAFKYGPRYAEIRAGNNHLTARHFAFHERKLVHDGKRNSGVLPSANNVYIQLPNGISYYSMLEPHKADHRQHRERYLMPGLTRMQPETSSTPSGSQTMEQPSQIEEVNDRGSYLQPEHNGMKPHNVFTPSGSQTMLQPYQTNHWKYQGGYPTKEFTTMHPLTALTTSSGKRLLDPHEADHRKYRGGYSSPRLPRLEKSADLTSAAASDSQASTYGFPNVPEQHIVVEMGDGSHFQGPLKGEDPHKVASWLASKKALFKDYRAIIFMESGACYSSKLLFITPINKNEHNLDYGPKYAEIRSGSEHLTARYFEREKGINSGVIATINHVYVSLKSGNIYTSALEPHKLEHRENRERVQRQGSPEWGELNDLDDTNWM